jgi:hypothetical protein
LPSVFLEPPLPSSNCSRWSKLLLRGKSFFK